MKDKCPILKSMFYIEFDGTIGELIAALTKIKGVTYATGRNI